MSKNRLLIMTWRQYGADDDSTTVGVCAADEEYDLKQSVAEEYGLDILDDDEKPGCIIITGRTTVEDGKIMEYGNRRFRVLVEEIDEQGETLGGMCNIHWDVRCSPGGTCPKCQANEDAAAEPRCAECGGVIGVGGVEDTCADCCDAEPEVADGL